MSAKGWADPVVAEMNRAHRLVVGLKEARDYLKRDDCEGRACPDCRGVYGHYLGCGRQQALDAIKFALSGEAEA